MSAREDRYMSITAHVQCNAAITGYEMGRAFANMDSIAQAEFFLGVHATTNDWDQTAGFQWVTMRQHLDDMPDALAAFKEMAEYGRDEVQS